MSPDQDGSVRRHVEADALGDDGHGAVEPARLVEQGALDSSAATTTFDLAPTPWEQTLEQTVAWWCGRSAVRSG